MLINNSEGRFDVLSHEVLKYLNENKMSMNVRSVNLESVDLNYGSKVLKDVHKMHIDDVLNSLK